MKNPKSKQQLRRTFHLHPNPTFKLEQAEYLPLDNFGIYYADLSLGFMGVYAKMISVLGLTRSAHSDSFLG